ncbi:conserved hypothetical protein [Desulfamplus magnetovallimortis]|uniref:Transposase (putative) YhgA-like domain-containing protein n=1 Tax=Desulfamplus magnetovallimortis TaxID=1246637 RepID=A0A1W1HC34_9BACT|nr:hypothetical protein [Desulfamplus magnetovallimortis]SLM29938.1 conserved hypothetical protein [Desulfamplus magnetovallimortis]
MPDYPDYDSPWKDIIERFFSQFTQFFFPSIYGGIDWNQEYTFLDKEFQELVRDSELGRRLADKLVRVHTLNGNQMMVLIHVEVQGNYELDFAERMYVYNYRIYDKYRYPVVSVALLADDSHTWRPSCFTSECWGFRLDMVFPMIKLLDYDDMVMLEKNPNPFAVVVMAYLKTRQTRHDSHERHQWKWYITLELYKRGYEKQYVIHLFLFIDWIMILPDELKKSFSEKLLSYEEGRKMRYVSSVEEYCMEKGMLKDAREMVAEVLSTKFSAVPDHIMQRISAIEDRHYLKQLLKKAVLSPSIEQFELEFQG